MSFLLPKIYKEDCKNIMVSDNTIENDKLDKMNSENVDIVETIDPEKQKELNKLKRQQNLVSLADLSPERRKEISSLGGKARSRQMIQEKSMRDSAKALLKTAVSREYATKIMGEDADISGVETIQDLLIARMIREVLENGNGKAAEFIRDTSGEKPVSTAALDIKADIVTAADRALIEKVADRLGMVDITDKNDDENA